MILSRALAGLRARLTNSTGRSAIVALDLPRSRGTAEEVSVDIENLIVTAVGAKNMHRLNERTVEAYALKRGRS